MAREYMKWLVAEVPEVERDHVFGRFRDLMKKNPGLLRELETKTPHEITIRTGMAFPMTLAVYLRMT